MQQLEAMPPFHPVRITLTSIVLVLLTGIFFDGISGISLGEESVVDPENGTDDRAGESLPVSEKEALGRARWVHEAMHGALQVMHRDFFGDGDDGGGASLSLPSQSLEDVFKEMARSWKVEIRWLGVNATKAAEHEPADDFEKAAARALKAGEKEFSGIENENFRFVGAIRLQNQCLKCHVPYRSSLEDRIAGLAISFPLNMPQESSEE